MRGEKGILMTKLYNSHSLIFMEKYSRLKSSKNKVKLKYINKKQHSPIKLCFGIELGFSYLKKS